MKKKVVQVRYNKNMTQASTFTQTLYMDGHGRFYSPFILTWNNIVSILFSFLLFGIIYGAGVYTADWWK